MHSAGALVEDLDQRVRCEWPAELAMVPALCAAHIHPETALIVALAELLIWH